MADDLKVILDQRQADYGDAETNFKNIGRGWGAILGIEDISETNIALMFDFAKSIRLSNNPTHADSWLDKQGYTQHGQSIAMKGSE